MISLHNVSKVYPVRGGASVAALDGVSLQVERGEFLVITGRSGSGKTTLLNLAAGLTRPTKGEVLFEGANLWKMGDRNLSLLRNQKIGFIFQFPSLIPALTVLQNVALPTVFAHGAGDLDGRVRARELLETVGLADKLNAYPSQLSAGQQQRVVIARSLLNHPELLLADEATSNLDEQTEREIMSLLKEVHTKMQVTVLMVAHSSDLVPYGTRAIRMAGGKIVD